MLVAAVSPLAGGGDVIPESAVPGGAGQQDLIRAATPNPPTEPFAGRSGLDGKLPYLSTYEIVQTLPHDGESFTQGLAFRKGTLYESKGLYGKSGVRRINPGDGSTIDETSNTADIFGEGLAFVDGDDKVAQLSWRENQIFEFNAADLSLVNKVVQPSEMREGWGLASDGRTESSVLYASDGTDALFHLTSDGTYRVGKTIRAVDSKLGSAKTFAGLPGGGALHGLNELEVVPVGKPGGAGDGEVWANLYPMNQNHLSECIVRLDPATGEALGWVDMRGLLAAQREKVREGSSHFVLNGIAYDRDDDRLMVTGKQWDNLYRIRIVPHPDPSLDVRSACFSTWDSYARTDAHGHELERKSRMDSMNSFLMASDQEAAAAADPFSPFRDAMYRAFGHSGRPAAQVMTHGRAAAAALERMPAPPPRGESRAAAVSRRAGIDYAWARPSPWAAPSG